MKDYAKSRDYRQRASKSGIIEERSEDDEIKKIKELLDKLDKEVKSHPIKINSKATSKFTILGENNVDRQNLSFMGRAGKGVNEDKNNREFILNFLNHDSLPILPKDLHLLTDNDANQNISDDEKFKNLANLLIDNSDSVVERYFVRDSKEEVNLHLFTAFSRKSKDVFLDENQIEQEKNRLLLLKLNGVDIPTLNIIDKTEYEQKYKIKAAQYRENLLKNILKPLNSNTSQANSNNAKNNKKENKEKLENKNCVYFRQKDEKYFVMPTLIQYIPPSNNNLRRTFKGRSSSMRKIKSKTKNEVFEQKEKSGYSSPRTSRAAAINTLKKLEKEKNPNFWDPEIDGDTLSYINHNIICIEDIYNKNQKDYYCENKKEKEIIPIETKEILSDYDGSSEEGKNLSKSLQKDLMDDDNNDTYGEKKKIKNKFTEFNDYCPKLAKIKIKKDKKILQERAFNNDLKLLINYKIGNITAFHDKSFSKKVINLNGEKLYRFVKNNETNEKSTQDSFSIEASNKNKDTNEKNAENINPKTIEAKKKYSSKKNNNIRMSKNKKLNDSSVNEKLQLEKNNMRKENKNRFKEIQKLFFDIDIEDNEKGKEKEKETEKNIKQIKNGNLYSIDENESNAEKSLSRKNFNKNLSKIFKDKDKLSQSSIDKITTKKIENSEDSILKLYSSESN